jgi:L-lactate dehydrogenase (cytochrome)
LLEYWEPTGLRNADEFIAFHENRDAFQRYFFRPRILRDMTDGSTETNIMGIPSALPVFIASAAVAKLGHPLGEINITKAAGEMGIIQGASSNTLPAKCFKAHAP